MKIKDLESFIELEKEIGTLCVNIFNYVKENFPNKVRYGINAFFDSKILNENGLTVKYYDNGEIMTYHYLPTIPLHLLEDENSWKQFLDEYYDKQKLN